MAEPEPAPPIDERDAIVVDDPSVAYAKATLEHTGLALTNSNLFCLIWVCVQTLCSRGMPLELIFGMMQDAKDATPKPEEG